MVRLKVRDTVIGLLVGSVLFFPYSTFLNREVKPYRDVMYTIEQNELGYVVKASFEKTACVFESLDILGTVLGQKEALLWYDVEGNKGNRDVGRHAFTLQAETGDQLSSLEVITRHRCSGDLVERTFLEETFTK